MKRKTKEERMRHLKEEMELHLELDEEQAYKRRKGILELEIRLEKERQQTLKMQSDFERVYIKRLEAEHRLGPKIKKEWKDFWEQEKRADEKHKEAAKKELNKMFG